MLSSLDTTLGPFDQIAFFHVPRCGGTSLLDAFYNRRTSGRIYQCTSFAYNHRLGLCDLFSMSDTAKNEMLIWFGHHLHEELHVLVPGRRLLFATCLREPLSRLHSHFLFDMQQAKKLGLPFDEHEWITSINNPMCNFFLDRFPSHAGCANTEVETVKSILATFDAVFFIERPHQIDTFFKPLNVYSTNISRLNATVADTQNIAWHNVSANAVEALHSDLTIYRWAMETYESINLTSAIADLARKHDRRTLRLSKTAPEHYTKMFHDNKHAELAAYGLIPTAARDMAHMATRLHQESNDLTSGG